MPECAYCGVELVRRAREAFYQFEARRYCSRRCRGLSENPRKSETKARYRQIHTPDGRRMLEHRYVMEQAIGRPLTRDEQVHHINHNRLDNRIENLELVTSAEHGLRHTVHPTTKVCAACGSAFTPHKTKRVRAQTCGPDCRAQLLRLRAAERRAKA